MQAAPDAISLVPDEVAGGMTFRDVSFHYPTTERLVLADVNIEVHPGETIALVGRSGAWAVDAVLKLAERQQESVA